jgi:AcrR family transcriptional regulator
MAQVRPYAGVEASERIAMRRRRFVDAGLELLGGSDNPSELTVRALCGEAGISARYFYEAFTDKDDLVAAVFDSVIADIAATTQAAVAAAPPDEQNRAGITNLVRAIADDARIARLMFNPQLTNSVLARKRAGLGGFFAILSSQHVTTAYQVPQSDWVKTLAHFVTGGVGQALIAWVAGDVDMEPEQVVDQLVSILDVLADPRLSPRSGSR